MWNSNPTTNDHVGSNGSTTAIPPDTVLETPDFDRAPDPDIDTNNLALFTVINGSSNNTLGAFCFGKGTLIATPGGDVTVESLAIGDPILTSDGRSVPVKWIGLQTVHKLRAGPRMEPVRFRAGAWGDGQPCSDLIVTADHGMVIDGFVINASALVNGSSIDWVPMDELDNRVTYYHVETENHDVILANGIPAETFVDYAGRQAFDNYAEYADLYGAERIIPEMDHLRISSRRLVPDAIKARFGIGEQVGSSESALSA
ncbi:MAG: Hint domain-containing protein [Rhodobacteraceae bacterium]|nr:MAG: Hint domain-containing protein [Paracoccaceae bacterium]